MPPNFADGLRMIIHAPEVIAVGHGRKRAVQWQDFQPMPGKVELADNLRPQQRDHVRALGKQEPGKDFFRHRRAAQQVPAFQNDDFLTGFGEVRRVDEPIMAAADDDGVVVLPHSVRLRYDAREEMQEARQGILQRPRTRHKESRQVMAEALAKFVANTAVAKFVSVLLSRNDWLFVPFWI